MAKTLSSKANYFMLDFCWFILIAFRNSMWFFGVALIVNLYKRAMAFEKEFIPDDPEKEQLIQTVDEINELVQAVHNAHFDTKHENDNKFEN